MCVFFPGIPAARENAAGGFRGKSISSLRELSLFYWKVWRDLVWIVWRSPAIWIRVDAKTRGVSVMQLHCTLMELEAIKVFNLKVQREASHNMQNELDQCCVKDRYATHPL